MVIAGVGSLPVIATGSEKKWAAPAYLVVIGDSPIRGKESYYLITVVDQKGVDKLLDSEDARTEAEKYPVDDRLPKLIDQFRRGIQPGNPRALVVQGTWKFSSARVARAARLLGLSAFEESRKGANPEWIKLAAHEFKATMEKFHQLAVISSGADQPATAPESTPDGNAKPKPGAEGRSQ